MARHGLVTRRLLFSYFSILAVFLIAGSILIADLSKSGLADKQSALAEQLSIVQDINNRLSNINPQAFTSAAGNPLFDLLNQRKIAGWRLIDADKNVVAEGKAGGLSAFSQSAEQNPGLTLYRWYFPNPDDNGWRLDIQLLNAHSTINSGIESLSFALLIFAGLIAAVGFWQFGWIIKLEQYAKYIITGEHRAKLSQSAAESGIISQAMNQLMLSNSLLNQEKNELSQQIRKVSYIDEITGLGNQWFFKAEFEVRLHSGSAADSGLLMILGFVNDQQLKLNDSDRQEIATVLQSFVQSVPGALVSRLRENDFALLLPNESQQQIDRHCKKLVSDLDKTIFSRQGYSRSFVDIGISVYQKNFEYYKVMAEADMALRNAQLQGDNSWYIYGEPLANHLKMGNLRWRTLLQKILANEKILLWRQPVFELAPNQREEDRKQVLYNEVLARIQIQDKVVGADVFMPMAVRCGLAIDIDRHIVESALSFDAYAHTDTDAEPERYAVKLFNESLNSTDFRLWLLDKVARLNHCNLIFEVAEFQLSQLDNALAQWMNDIKEKGGQWCVEHFGSPHQKMEYLHFYPLDFVKIDRRIIHSIESQPTQQLLLKSYLVELKHNNITIIAEGIESESELTYITGQEIKYGQGYYLAEPEPLLTKNLSYKNSINGRQKKEAQS